MDVRVKRVYEPAERSDGYRILIDRLWPRGVSHDRARLDAWERDLAPSAALRTWFAPVLVRNADGLLAADTARPLDRDPGVEAADASSLYSRRFLRQSSQLTAHRLLSRFSFGLRPWLLRRRTV